MGVTKEEVARIIEACAPVSPKMGLALAKELQAARAQLADRREFGMRVAKATVRACEIEEGYGGYWSAWDIECGKIVDTVMESC